MTFEIRNSNLRLSRLNNCFACISHPWLITRQKSSVASVDTMIGRRPTAWPLTNVSQWQPSKKNCSSERTGIDNRGRDTRSNLSLFLQCNALYKTTLSASALIFLLDITLSGVSIFLSQSIDIQQNGGFLIQTISRCPTALIACRLSTSLTHCSWILG